MLRIGTQQKQMCVSRSYRQSCDHICQKSCLESWPISHERTGFEAFLRLAQPSTLITNIIDLYNYGNKTIMCKHHIIMCKCKSLHLKCLLMYKKVSMWDNKLTTRAIKFVSTFKFISCSVGILLLVTLITVSTDIALVIIMLFSRLLTLPVNVDRSSPPITLISPVDWSFCENKNEVDMLQG